jgi:hypothetical protein
MMHDAREETVSEAVITGQGSASLEDVSTDEDDDML